MSKRLLFVAAIVLLVGFFTRAFAQDAIDANISPDQPINRAGAVALMVSADPANLPRVQWYAAHMPPMPLFRDVDQRQWYAPYLEVAFEQGIVTGNSNRLFRPSDAINQAEAIALATRYKEAHSPDAGVFLTIPGSDTNWLNGIVLEAQTNDITLPFPVRPDSIITRGTVYDLMRSAGVTAPEQVTIALIPVTTQLPADILDQSSLQPLIANRQLVAENDTTSPITTAPASLLPPTTQPAATQAFTISMPSLGISNLGISHPADFTHDGLLAPLKSGVGHLFSYPGQSGKILVYGHSSGYPWDVSKYTKIFRQINKLSVGDLVYVTYNGTLYTYQVTTKQTVPANDMSAYAQSGKEELILYTCWPPDSIKQRYLVHATPVTTTVASN